MQMKSPVLVLVVDDEPLIRMSTADVLREAGYRVEEAANSDEALNRLSGDGHEAAALITDIEMPGRLNGVGLAWRVRTLHPEAALLVISGVARPSADELPAGAQFLPKPTSPQQLVQALRQALAAR
jgi:two-component system, response regulator PdtaR